jgi:hypothetical protein
MASSDDFRCRPAASELAIARNREESFAGMTGRKEARIASLPPASKCESHCDLHRSRT